MKSLREIRESKDLTSVEIARRLNISQGYYSHLERGTRKATDEMMSRLSRVLEVSSEEVKNIFEDKNPLSHIVVNNWVPKIRINDMPVFKAFREETVFFVPKSHEDAEDKLKRFIKFVEYNIGNSIERELERDSILKEFVMNKII
jgi:transcriptional regulator with XRE-family HTH domain